MNRKNMILLISGIILTLVIATIGILMVNKNKNNNSNINIDKIAKIENETDVENNDITKENNDNLVLDIKVESDYIMPENINTTSSYIIIGKINSVDGGINYNESKKIYTVPQTIGSIEVIRVIKGDITEKVIPFIRVGGIVTFEEYENSLVESQKTKLELTRTLSAKEKKEKYVSVYEYGDIQPEKDKEYLMYLCYDEDYDRYNIQYLFYGLREIENTTNNSISTMSNNELRVKNNVTGEYENLSDVIGDLNSEVK